MLIGKGRADHYANVIQMFKAQKTFSEQERKIKTKSERKYFSAQISLSAFATISRAPSQLLYIPKQ